MLNDADEREMIKVGDYVGIAGTWNDDTGLEEVGLVIEVDIEEAPTLKYKSDLANRWFGDAIGWAKVFLPNGEIEPWDINNLEIIFAAKE